MSPSIRIGTAGWSINRMLAPSFSPSGSALERYGSVFDCVEINSSFYRPHKEQTYARWAASVPDTFRFSVKLPKAISHEAGLVGAEDLLEAFARQILMLGPKLGAVLVQLPPGLRFDQDIASAFFAASVPLWSAPTLCEPRHPSWFTKDALFTLAAAGVSLVGADPARIEPARTPIATGGLAYWRLHGAPEIYYSSYSEADIAAYKEKMLAVSAPEAWCIFDNTASGAALENALRMKALVSEDALGSGA